jgi:hypothetical protein
LQSTGSDQEIFARDVGRKVQVRGTKSSGQSNTFKVMSISRVSGHCGQAK